MSRLRSMEYQTQNRTTNSIHLSRSSFAKRIGAMLYESRRSSLQVGLLLLLFICSACGPSVRELYNEPLDRGVERHYDADIRSAVLATRNAVAASPLEVWKIQQVDSDVWILYACGERSRLRITCQSTGRNQVCVRIVTHPITWFYEPRDWSESLFTQIGLELGVE